MTGLGTIHQAYNNDPIYISSLLTGCYNFSNTQDDGRFKINITYLYSVRGAVEIYSPGCENSKDIIITEKD